MNIKRPYLASENLPRPLIYPQGDWPLVTDQLLLLVGINMPAQTGFRLEPIHTYFGLAPFI